MDIYCSKTCIPQTENIYFREYVMFMSMFMKVYILFTQKFSDPDLFWSMLKKKRFCL